MATVTRPCYVTRDEVMRALDVSPTAAEAQKIDGLCMAGTEFVDAECQRHFYPIDATYTFDWPNYQYTYPWKLYLNQLELAAAPTKVVSGFYLPTPVDITANVIAQPINDGPPFTSIELRRDKNSAFGNNPTPQNDIAITGTFGYWLNLVPCTNLAVALVDTTGTTVQTAAGPTAGPGAGDVIVIGSERLLVTDINYSSTGITAISGGNNALKNDNVIAVANGTLFSNLEVILMDQEFMLITNVLGNNLIVQRAWGGSILATHSSPVIWANRLLTVTRGALGTTAATHLTNAPVLRCEYPSLVRQVARAHALIGQISEPAAYSVQTTASWFGSNARMNDSQRTPAAGVGFQGLLTQLQDSIFVRKARSAVI